MLSAGVRRVVDLGCGIGTDALAFARAGLDVVAVDSDPVMADDGRRQPAIPRRRHLRGGATGIAEDLWSTLRPVPADHQTGVFCDPARRTGRGRSWRVEDLSPSWAFVTELLGGAQPTGVKLGPGLSHQVIPAEVEAEWLSSRGDTVEAGLWTGRGSTPGLWSALVVDDPPRRLRATVTDRPPVDRPRMYLYEPLGESSAAVASLPWRSRWTAPFCIPTSPISTADEAVDTAFATKYDDSRELSLPREGPPHLGHEQRHRCPRDQDPRPQRGPGDPAPTPSSPGFPSGDAGHHPDQRGTHCLRGQSRGASEVAGPSLLTTTTVLFRTACV